MDVMYAMVIGGLAADAVDSVSKPIVPTVPTTITVTKATLAVRIAATGLAP